MSERNLVEEACAAPPAAEPVFARLLPGDRLPSLEAECDPRPNFAFDTLAGRYLLYCFFLALDDGQARAHLRAVADRPDLFNDVHCSFVGVSVTPRDRDVHRLRNRLPGYRFAFDLDHRMSCASGAVPFGAIPGERTPVRRCWMLVDPSLHILRIFDMGTTPVEEVIAAVEALPPPDRFGGIERPAPILLLPNVLEPDLCQRLVDLYDADGGTESGVHRDGQPVLDSAFKRRRDYKIADQRLLDELKSRIARRVLPEVEKLFFMRAHFIERHIVGCYSAADRGHFSPHRDNGPGLTAHRRFAVSINLSNDFDGGEVVFPEYNQAGYKAPLGWAVVFPCAILHAVRRVTRGARYAYLPFIYDEGGHQIRQVELARAVAAAADQAAAGPGQSSDLSR